MIWFMPIGTSWHPSEENNINDPKERHKFDLFIMEKFYVDLVKEYENVIQTTKSESLRMKTKFVLDKLVLDSTHPNIFLTVKDGEDEETGLYYSEIVRLYEYGSRLLALPPHPFIRQTYWKYKDNLFNLYALYIDSAVGK